MLPLEVGSCLLGAVCKWRPGYLGKDAANRTPWAALGAWLCQ